jgi:hypothetical protein
LAGSGCAGLRLQQPTDPADLIHLLQKLYILFLEAGVIGAHVLFFESLDNPLKKENPPFQKREKHTNIVTSQNYLFYLMGASGTGESNSS